MSPPGSTLIRPVNGRRWLVPASSTRCVVMPPCGVPSGRMFSERNGLTTFRRWNRCGEGRWYLSAGGASSACEEFGASQPGHVPFWSKPVSLFGLFLCDGVYRHFTLRSPCPRSWFPTALRLVVVVLARAFTTLPVGRRLRCSWSFRPPRYQRRRSR